jgi:hypothetical protein
MAISRLPGVICQTRDWYADLDDGTLARMPSPLPSTLGAAPVGGASSPPQQLVASGPCEFLNPRLRGTVRAPQEAFDRLRSSSGAARVSPPQPRTSQSWPDGSSSAAIEQTIQIGRQTIQLIRPTEADALGKNLPTSTQLADALRAIPADQRAHTTRVLLSPRAHPDSTATRTIAGDAGSGEITLFPVNGAQSQNDFDNRLTHESGHNYQGTLWHSGGDVQAWRSAAAADNRLPSPYAGENPGDDFCEFGILFNTARGTPCEAVARQLYPNRWLKMLEYQSP